MGWGVRWGCCGGFGLGKVMRSVNCSAGHVLVTYKIHLPISIILLLSALGLVITKLHSEIEVLAKLSPLHMAKAENCLIGQYKRARNRQLIINRGRTEQQRAKSCARLSSINVQRHKGICRIDS